MSSSSIRKHAGTGAATDQPAVPEPSFAERARTLVYMARIGSLSTLSRKQPGFPFGSVMPYGLDEQGRPIFLIKHDGYAYSQPPSGLTCQPACYPA